MLLLTDVGGRNAWQNAAFCGDLDVMQNIWVLIKERLTTEEIKNEMFLRTDGEGRKAWHFAAYRGVLDAMQKIWEFVKERLTSEEKEMKCYYTQTIGERTLGTLRYLGAN